jgi:hypothetical protein
MKNAGIKSTRDDFIFERILLDSEALLVFSFDGLGIIHKWRHPRRGEWGYPQRVARGDKGRDPIFGRGDITQNCYSDNIFDCYVKFSQLSRGQTEKKKKMEKILMCQKYSCFLNSKNSKNSIKSCIGNHTCEMGRGSKSWWCHLISSVEQGVTRGGRGRSYFCTLWGRSPERKSLKIQLLKSALRYHNQIFTSWRSYKKWTFHKFWWV